MSSYTDLSDNVDDTFDFILRGKKYVMRYPTTEELEEIQDLNTEYEALEDKTTDEAKMMNEKLTNATYNFIKPEQDGPSIKEVLKKENVKVLSKFNNMIKNELKV